MLLIKQHGDYIKRTLQEKDILFYLTEQDRMATLFWSLNSLKILMDPYFENLKPFAIKYVMSCLKDDGGFGPTPEYTSNMLSTLYALQILFISDILYYSKETVDFIAKLQNVNGSFMNDQFGEMDTRIDCCAILSLHILYVMKDHKNKNFMFSFADKVHFKNCKFEYDNLEDNINSDLDDLIVNKIQKACKNPTIFDRNLLSNPIPSDFIVQTGIDLDLFVIHILKCNNFDGGFGQIEGSESHTAQIFCCVSILRSLGMIDRINVEKTVDFIVFRQTKNGGFNGRINKKEDVCYSFWAYASLVILNSPLIDSEKLIDFILRCQDENGGFSDRPENQCDIFHLMFSLASLSLLGDKSLNVVDPGFAM